VLRTWNLGTAAAAAVLFTVTTLSPLAVLAQTRVAKNTAAPANGGGEARTPWGHPDLQGIWTNSTITPLERPAKFAGREFLTDEEVRTLDSEAAVRGDQRSTNVAADVDAAYNQFWWERGNTVASRRTSLIVDPPDGRLPALTPDGEKRAAAVASRLRASAAGPEDRNLAERCVTRGAPKLPGGYNNNFQIVQTPTHVAIMQEMIHEARIIPLDGRPHLPQAMGFYLGDSRGRWDGDTLVVETTNYHALSAFNSYNFARGAGDHLRVVERFRRTGANTIDHQFTVEDPTTFTRAYTVAVPMTRIDEQIFEYACHEGNYGMTGILKGARALEREAATKSSR
jgi:hypothetical protein